MSTGKYIKGMVLVDGVTYRVVRVASGSYEAIRLSDEVLVGRFSIEEKVRLEPTAVDAPVLRRIAREAMQRGKTSRVFHQTPPPPAVAVNEPEPAEESAPHSPRRLAPA